MVDFARLVLAADTRQMRTAVRDIDSVARSGSRAESQAERMNAMYRRAATGIAVAASAAVALGRALRGAEQYTRITNSLRAVGFEGDAAARALDQVAEVANRTRSPLEATAQLYQRISIAGKDLGASRADALRFTENVGLALAQTGTSAAQASGALMQLQQAMGAGTVRAEEFNSILEVAFPIAQAAANGIDGAAGSVGRLRQMVINGEVSSKQFFDAILNSTEALEEAFAQTVPTMSQAFTVLGNNVTMFVGKADAAVGVSAAIARAMLVAADNVERLAFYAASAAVIIGGKFVASMVLAAAQTFTLSGALVALRTALIRTGIGVLIIGAGELALRFSRLVSAAGGFGNAMSLLKDVAVEVWGRVGQSAGGLLKILGGVAKGIQAAFVGAFAYIGEKWDALINGMSGPFNSLMESIGSNVRMGTSAIGESLRGVQDELKSTAIASIEAGGAMLQAARDPLQSLAALRAAMEAAEEGTEEAAAATEAYNDALDENSKGSKAAAAEAKRLADEIQRLEFDADPVKRYNAEIAKLDKLLGQGLSAKAYAKAVEDLNDELADSVPMVNDVADAFGEFVARGFKDFKSFTESVVDSFQGMIAQMVATAARNRIMISLGLGGGGSLAGTAASAAGGMMGGGGGLLSGAGGLLSGVGALGAGLMQGVTGAFTALTGTGAFAGVGGLGAMGGYISSAFGAATSGAIGLGAALGAVALPLAGLVAAFSFFSSKTSTLDKGLMLTADSAGVLVEQFERIKRSRFWGLSTSKRTNVTEAGAAIADPIEAAVAQMQGAVIDAAAILGTGQEAFADFAYSAKISLKGLSDEEATQKVNEELAKMGDAFASLVPHISSLNELLAVADQRWQIENRILQLQGRDAELLARLRERELDATHELNKALMETVFALEDQVAAEMAAAQLANQIATEREGLERQLLTLQGNTAELRRRELEALNPANRALQLMIWGLEDAKKALDAIDPSRFATLFDFNKAQAQARNGVVANSGAMPFYAVTPASAPVSAEQNAQARRIEDLITDFMDQQKQIGLQTLKHVKKTADLAIKDDAIGTPPVRSAS